MQSARRFSSTRCSDSLPPNPKLQIKRLVLTSLVWSLNFAMKRYQRICLERMIFFGEGSLRKAVHEFTLHYHHERNHQGLGNRLIAPEAGHLANAGPVRRRQRLGGMLNYYYRQAA